MLAFVDFWEAGNTTVFAVCVHHASPSCQHFMDIGLMADIPDNPVRFRVVHMVERYAQLRDSETGGEVAAIEGNEVDEFAPAFIGKGLQLPDVELLQIAGGLTV